MGTNQSRNGKGKAVEDVTPNDMPGAGAETEPSAPAAPTTPAAAELTGEERAELERLRANRKDERLWEKRAKENFDDAQKWRDLLDKSGATDKDDFDPRAEIDKLHKLIDSKERERIRADIAREENVNPRWVIGDSEEAMRESAKAYRDDVAASTPKTAPAAAPAAEVTSAGNVRGQKQLTHGDLESMTPKQILEARNAGQLDDLMGVK